MLLMEQKRNKMKYLSLLFLFLVGCNENDNQYSYSIYIPTKLVLTNVVCDYENHCKSSGKIIIPDSLQGRIYVENDLLGMVGDTVYINPTRFQYSYNLK